MNNCKVTDIFRGGNGKRQEKKAKEKKGEPCLNAALLKGGGIINKKDKTCSLINRENSFFREEREREKK
jgi:hypothetical protein